MLSLKKVALVELAYHHEVLRSYILICLEISDEIKIFTLKEIFLHLIDFHDNPKIRWFLLKNQNLIASFIPKWEVEFKQCGLLIAITLSNDLNFFSSYKFPITSWLVIHNYKTYFNPSFADCKPYPIGSSFKGILKELKYYLFNERKKINLLVSNYNNIVFPSKLLKDNIENYHHLGIFPNAIYLDFTVFEKKFYKNNNDLIKIVIPGSVSSNTRDYALILNAFKCILPQLERKIELYFLGPLTDIKASKFVFQLEKMQNQYFSLYYFKSIVDQNTFDKIIMHADFLILPLKRHINYDIFKEEFGYTKVSGSIGQMIKYGIPTILPDFYPLDKVLESLVVRYRDSASLIDQIQYLINSDFSLIKRNSINGLVQYNSTNLAKKLINQISQ